MRACLLMAALLMLTVPLAVSSDAGAWDVYLIKVVLDSDSDWTSVIFLSGVKIVNVRHAVVKGEVQGLGVAWDETWLGMNRCCYPDRVINATVEFEVLITNVPVASTMSMSVMKGDVGKTHVLIYNRLGTLIKEVVNRGVVPGSGGRNPMNFSVPSARVVEPGRVHVLGQGRFSRIVWAAYYPWYTKGSWNDPHMADRPLIGEYSSDDPNTIRTHVRLARAAGIDGFAVSWWGPNTYTDRNLRKLLDIAGEEGLHVAAYLESLTGDGNPRPLPEIESMLSHLITSYGGHPAYYKVDGKPLVFVWAAWSHDVEEWRSVFNNLRNRGIDAFYVATASNTKYLEAFDGLQNYGTGNVSELKRFYDRVGPLVKTHHVLYGGRERLWVPSISPGYDERLLPGRKGLYYDRDEGRYYLATYDRAAASFPDWIWITSFNEWWENTHIEPSKRYGYRYMFLTEQLTSQFKGRTSDPGALLELILELERRVETVTITQTLLKTVTQQLTHTLTIDRTTTIHKVEVKSATLTVEREVMRSEALLFVALPLLITTITLAAYVLKTRVRHG